MNAAQFDTALMRWLQTQPNSAASNYHVQIKLWSSEVEMAQLTALELPGWVILNWRKRALGLSLKHAQETPHAPSVAHVLEPIAADVLHAQVQVIIAPAPVWTAVYTSTSLSPDLIKVLDTDTATVLNVTAERRKGDWQIILAHLPPSDEPLASFAAE